MMTPIFRCAGRGQGATRWAAAVAILAAAGVAAAQDGSTAPVPAQPMGVWPLFLQSFDLFTVLLLLGSITAGAYIFRCVVEVRPRAILSPGPIGAIEKMIAAGRFAELKGFVDRDRSFVSAVLGAALKQPAQRGAMREAAELAASEQVANWFRKIEPLNVIGNLGPLVGLAGTVWGMILAFTSLGQAGGQAGPADLSLGISKALFHTLLGLCLAIPCLLIFGFYRSIIDKHCTRVMVVSAELVEKLPAEEEAAVGAK
jgi:biopolymer transport protein ExbB